MHGLAVIGGAKGDRAPAEFANSSNDSYGDFSTIGDQDCLHLVLNVC
jgi:hypothetical protein